MTAMTVAPSGHPARERMLAVMTPALTVLRLSAARWAARRRLSRSITHLDDRLLADVGLRPQQRGFSDRLIRRIAPGGGIWGTTDWPASRR